MPTVPNFVFTDPVAAQQYVQMASIAQAEEEARNRAMLGTLQALNQRGMSRDTQDTERSRIASQADIARAQREASAKEAEAGRIAQAGSLEKELQSNERIAKMGLDAETARMSGQLGRANEAERYNLLRSMVESGDPPTDFEFAKLSEGLSPDRKVGLDTVRQRTISELNQNADIADKVAAQWNERLNAIANPANKSGVTRDQIVDAALKSNSNRYILFDPEKSVFMSKVRRPRIDQQQSSVQKLDDVINRVRAMGGRAPVTREGIVPGPRPNIVVPPPNLVPQTEQPLLMPAFPMY